MNLFELTNIWKTMEALIESDEATEEEMAEAMKDLNVQIEEKADGYAEFLRRLEGEEEALIKEKRRLTKRITSLQKKQNNLKRNLRDAMIETKKTKFRTTFHTFTVRKNPPALVIENTESIPEEFIKITREVNRADLKKAVLEGLEIDGVYLTQTESVQIG